MARELSTEIENVTTAERFTYYDWLIVTLPLKSGESAPIVIRVAPADITMESRENFSVFTYEVFLGAMGRTPLASEQDDWVIALETALETSQAALLTEAQNLIDGLFTSSEYIARDRTDYEYVGDLYTGYLNRTPEAGGRAFWMDQVAASDRDTVRLAFATSQEFINRIDALSSPQHFEPDIRSISPLTISKGRAIDNVDISLTNVEKTYSPILNEDDRILYPARAVVGRAFEVEPGVYKSDDILTGSVRFGQISRGSAPLTVVSDMSRKGASVAEQITQRCMNIYKGPGCDSPDPSPTCSRIFDDAENGCAAKEPALVLIGATNNQPSFNGAPQPSGSSTPPDTTGGSINNSGFDYSGLDPRDTRIRENAGNWKFDLDAGGVR
ncbi:MAG TPA: DUF4214 domain-containing protein [Pyrinomonadaceae bacterium]